MQKREAFSRCTTSVAHAVALAVAQALANEANVVRVLCGPLTALLHSLTSSRRATDNN